MDYNFDNKDFEKFIRTELQQVDETPADNSWGKIAARQQKANIGLKTIWYAKMIVPILAVSAAVLMGIRYMQHHEIPAKPTSPATESMAQTAPQHNDYNPSNPELVPSSSEAMTHRLVVEAIPGQTGIVTPPDWYRQNDVPVAQIRFDAAQGVEYTNPASGNKVVINGSSLVYANGTPVTGPVDMLFREYRSIPDMLAADIPMHYNDDRGNFFFNSGGMFDVRVSQNGKELFMAPGQAYEVNFTASDNLSKASLFYLNNATNNWSYLSDQPFAGNTTFDARNMNAGNSQPPVSSEADVVRENTDNTTGGCLPEIPNFQPFADASNWVQEAIATGLDITTGKRRLPRWFINNPNGNDNYFAYSLDRSEIKLIFANDQVIRFFPQDINGIYTEFEAFKNCYFIRTGDSIQQIRQINSVEEIFQKNNTWRSLTIVPDNAKSGDCLMTLGSEKDGFIRIHAKLVRATESGIAEPFNASTVLQEYQRLREERLKRTFAELEQLRRFNETSKMFRTEKEWCMSDKEWLLQLEKNAAEMRNRFGALVKKGMMNDMALIKSTVDEWCTNAKNKQMNYADKVAAKLNSGQQLSTVLSLTGFGTYNCDQIFQLAQVPVYVPATYVNTDGHPISPASLRILDKKTKLFLTMNAKNMLVLPGRPMEILVTDTKGKVYHMNGTDYAKTTTKDAKSYTLTMTDISDSVHSPSGWAALLGI